MRPLFLAMGGVLLLAVTACAPAADANPQSQQNEQNEQNPQGGQQSESPALEDADSDQGAAVLEVAGRTFTFELKSCTVAPDGEVLLHGPGVEDGSDVSGYFDGDVSAVSGSLFGEFRVDIGSDSQFASSDEFIAMGSVGGDFTMTAEGEDHLAFAPAWDQNGTALGPASVRFRC